MLVSFLIHSKASKVLGMTRASLTSATRRDLIAMSAFPLSDEMDRLRRAGLASDFRITDEMDRKRREGGGSDFPLTDESERRRRLGLVYDFPLTEAFDKQRRDGSVSDFPLTDAYMKMQRDGNVSEYPLQDGAASSAALAWYTIIPSRSLRQAAARRQASDFL